jgi:hypothetical protein
MVASEEQAPTPVSIEEAVCQCLWPRPSDDSLMYVSQALSGGDYVSTGLFPRSAIGPRGGGRSSDNCQRVTTLMWDADLVTLYEALLVARGRPVPTKRSTLKQQMYRLAEDNLTILRNILVERLAPVWSDVIGVEPTAVLDSGWGVHIHLAVEHEVGVEVADLAAGYADLTRRINERVATVARGLRPSLSLPNLFDRLAVGSQLARQPGSINKKCEWDHRKVVVLAYHPEVALCGSEWERLQEGFGESRSMFAGLGLMEEGEEEPKRAVVPAPKNIPVEVDFAEKHLDGRTWSDIAYALAPGETVRVKCPFGGNSMGSGFFAREADGRVRYYSHVLQQTFWDTVLRSTGQVGRQAARLVMRPTTKRGQAPKPENTVQNLQLMLENDPEVELWWDDFVGQAMDGTEEMDDDWWLRIRLMMECKYNWKWAVGRELLVSTAQSVAKLSRQNRPRQWLDRLAAEWDGVKRLPEWMHRTLGVAKDNTLYREYSLRWPIGLVARMLEPGSKNDCMLVLQGKQGAGKSTVFDVWASAEDVQPGMFVDTRIQLGDKDALLTLAKAWIYEDAELLAHGSAGAAARKAFLSSRVDNFRDPYARRVTEHRRHCVVVGSTNMQFFLKDVTGSRRYWCVPTADKINLAWLRANRDQLLGEAVNRYRDGEAWWLSDAMEEAQYQDNLNYLRHTSYGQAAVLLREHESVEQDCFITTEMFAKVVGASVRDHHEVARGLAGAGWLRVRSSSLRGWSLLEESDKTWSERMAIGRNACSKLQEIWAGMFSP